MKAIAMGVHVLDVLVRPVEAIPEGQGGAARRADPMTAAGSAGGTALVLAKLGARGAQRGRDRHRRRSATCCSRCSSATASTPRCCCAATTSRPRRACCRSAPTARGRRSTSSARTRTYGPDDVDWDAIGDATHLHLGGPEFMGGEAAAKILARARASAASRRPPTSSRPGDAGILEWIAPGARAPRLPAAQRRAGARLHRRGRPRRRLPRAHRARRRLRRRDLRRRRRGRRRRRRGRARCRRSRSTSSTPPAAATRSAPASCAASSLGRSRRDAAVLGCAAAALVAQGLGTDHGDFDLAAADAFAAATPTR